MYKGYKKVDAGVCSDGVTRKYAILELEILGHIINPRLGTPMESRKLRTDRAKVTGGWWMISVNYDYELGKEIYELGKEISPNSRVLFSSMHDETFKYKIGQIQVPEKPFDDYIFATCTSGIHFFADVKDALKY